MPIPPSPVADSVANVLARWNAIYDAYNEVACLMLGSMTPEIHRQFKYYTPYEMLQELKSKFEKQTGMESDFVGFVRNYNMHNMGKKTGELHAMLIEYEKGLPKKAETPQVMAIKGGKIQTTNKKSLKAKEHPAKDETYHHCKEVGHWKRNCPIYLAELLKKKKQVDTVSLRGARNLEQGALYLYWAMVFVPK
nr:hypothetical protein [Tanacetum cinerariifolium]